MDTTTAIVLTGIVVTTGQWAQTNKGPSIKIVVGAMVAGAFLATMSNANEALASKYAVAILVGATLTYAEPIAVKLGYAKAPKKAAK